MAINTIQVHFRIRTDQGAVDGTPTWGFNEDSNGWPGVAPFRIRFEIQNTGSTQTANQAWQIYAQKNGSGGFTAVNTSRSDGIKSASASSDGDNTTLSTRRLTSAAGTWVNGQYDATGATASQRIGANSVTEFEFGLQFDIAVVNNNDYFDFEVYGGGAQLTTYTVTPRITVGKNALAADALRPASSAILGSAALAQIHVLAASSLRPASSAILGDATLQVIAAFLLGDRVLDNGLLALREANQIALCNAMPSDYASAVAARFGSKTFTPPGAFALPEDYADGRRITSTEVTDGDVSSDDTPTSWAVLDTTTSRLLAAGPLSDGVPITTAQKWTLDAFTINQPGA